MPQQSSTEIREEIDAALEGVKSLATLGLWTRMRRWIETSSHDGHLYIDGLAGTLERLSQKLERSPDQLSRLMAPLVKRGLITVADDSITSGHLKRLKAELRRQADKSSRHRQRIKGVTSPPFGGDAGVTVGVTPPPMVSPPITPSSLSPPSHTHGGGAPADSNGGDALDSQIRVFFRDHPVLLFSPVGHGNVRAMVEKAGWEKTREAIDTAIRHRAQEPTSYAKQVLNGRRAQEYVESMPKPSPARQSIAKTVTLGKV